MEGELVYTNVVVGIYLLRLISIIVRVIDLNLELLLLLEVVINHYFLDELRVKIVMDKLSLSNFLPLIVNRLV